VGEASLALLLEGFMDAVGLCTLQPILLDPRRHYEVFLRAVEELYLAPQWIGYVRRCYPEAPAGFHEVGSMANAPKPGPSPSPRLDAIYLGWDEGWWEPGPERF
jgi:hypothetical protein